LTILNLGGNLLIKTLPYRKDPVMASHRRAVPNPTIMILAMVASALLLAMGIWAAFTSPHPAAEGPMFQPLLPAAGPPPPGAITTSPLLDLVAGHGSPAPQSASPAAPDSVPYAQAVTNAAVPQKLTPISIQTRSGPRKISAPAETPSVSIQKTEPAPEVVPPPVEGGPCTGTASQCLDGVDGGALRRDAGFGLDHLGNLCLPLLNTDCKLFP
jgi:hypothetical protein